MLLKVGNELGFNQTGPLRFSTFGGRDSAIFTKTSKQLHPTVSVAAPVEEEEEEETEQLLLLLSSSSKFNPVRTGSIDKTEQWPHSSLPRPRRRRP